MIHRDVHPSAVNIAISVGALALLLLVVALAVTAANWIWAVAA